MGRLCRGVDWAQTAFGPVEGWPNALKALVASVLRQGMPQCLCWGPDLLQIYNDGYRIIMGDKHPAGLGRPVLENWAESAATIGPLLARVVAGETVYFEDFDVPVTRSGLLTDASFTFSYSPVLDDTGAIGGVLVNCFETTAAVRGRRAQAERDRLTAELLVEKTRLEATFQQSPSFFAILRGPENVFEAINPAYSQIVGLGRELLGRPLFDALPETRGQGFDRYLAQVRDTGEPLVFRDLPVRLERTPGAFEECFIDITYLPLREADGTHTAVIAHGVEVTEQVRARRRIEQLLVQGETTWAQSAAANEQLQEQALELELANQNLQDSAMELEAQAEELRASAAQLEERTEEAERARAKVESILESMADAYVAVDADFRIVAVNDAMVRGSGLSRNTLLGQVLWTCFPGALGTDVERFYRRAVTERLEAHFTHDYSDGRLDLVVDLDVYPAEGGGIAIFWRDVTLRERATRALQASETQMRSFADAIPTLAWVARADGYIEWYNARWYAYTGTSPAEMEGWGWQSVHDPVVLPVVMREWTAAIASGERFEMTFPLRGVDGTFHRFLTRVVPDYADDGHIARWFGTNTDIEGELAARDLVLEAAASTERLQRLTSALAAATTVDEVSSVVVADTAGLTGASSAGMYRRVPGTDEAVIVRHRGMDARLAARYARMSLGTPVPAAFCMRTGEPVFIESREGPEGFALRFPDIQTEVEGQGFHAIASVPLALGALVTGAISFTFSAPRSFSTRERAFFINVGEQAAQALERVRLLEAEHNARAEAEAAERRLRDIFTQAPIAVAVLTGPDLVYTVVSPQYAVTPGAGRTLLGRRVRDVFPEAEYDALLATMEQVFQTGEPYAVSERKVMLDPLGDGALEPHYYNVGYQPLRDATGQVYAIASLTNDVTEQVLARQQLEVAHQEAEHQRAVAEDANAAKGQILSTMSHELRTPLNASLGYVELLSMGLRGPVTDSQRTDLERIRLANQHLLSLINDILNFSRLEAGRLEFHPEPLTLDDVIAEIEPLVAPQLAAKGLAFEHDSCSTDTPETPHGVFVDRERLRQVLLNLITNATKFTDAGGRVSLKCVSDSSAPVVRIMVTDTGRGIPTTDLDRIFEPFVQIDRHGTHVSQQGVGLGLAISRELARGMDGELTVESEVGRGSTFILTVPRAPSRR